MALRGQEIMVALLVLMVTVWGGAHAQSNSCTSSLMALAPCLNFVTGNTTTPTPSCCLQLASVVQSQPRCLCSLLSGSIPNIGIKINQTLAVTLPGACRVQTPPMSLCNGVANGPASGPSSAAIPPNGSQTDPSEATPVAEAPTSPSVPSGSGSGSGSGSKATPATNNKASDGGKFGVPRYLLLFVLFFGMKL